MQHQRYRPQTSVKPCALMLAILSCLAIQARAHAAERGRDTAVSNDATPAPAAGKTAAPASDDAADPQAQASGQAVPEKKARAGAAGKAEADKVVQLGAVTVTAQKREERPQDVPIALSVFDAQSLDDHKIEGGAELLRATPNVTFSKSNFASYNFSIRGVGTKALSVTTDPGVAVSFNSTPLIRNRLFEQEYFDVNRIEVLRGPQGTLYGRNATGGVVNMLPNLPSLDGFDSWFKAETGNFDSRRFSGMVNVPIGSTLAYRLAGAWTKRSGYDNNTVTNKDVNGRDLWGGRMDTTNPVGQILLAENGTLVDNAFAVPAAKGCGNTLLPIPIITPILQGIVSAAVNLKEGLPAAAGKNTAIMTIVPR